MSAFLHGRQILFFEQLVPMNSSRSSELLVCCFHFRVKCGSFQDWDSGAACAVRMFWCCVTPVAYSGFYAESSLCLQFCALLKISSQGLYAARFRNRRITFQVDCVHE